MKQGYFGLLVIKGQDPLKVDKFWLEQKKISKLIFTEATRSPSLGFPVLFISWAAKFTYGYFVVVLVHHNLPF